MDFKTLKEAVIFSTTINILLFTVVSWLTQKNLRLPNQISTIFQTHYGLALVFLVSGYILLILVKDKLTEIELIEHSRMILGNLIITVLLFLTLLNPHFFQNSVGLIIIITILINIFIPMLFAVALCIKLFFPNLTFPLKAYTISKHGFKQIDKTTNYTHKIKEERVISTKWKNALLAIYRNDPHAYGRGKDNYGSNHPLIKILKVSPHQLMLIMSRLNAHKLIDYDKQDYNNISLTTKGFDVALELEKQKKQLGHDYVIMVFTAILAFSSVISLLKEILSVQLIIIVSIVFWPLLFVVFNVMWHREKIN